MEKSIVWDKIWKKFPRFFPDKLLYWIWYSTQFKIYKKVLINAMIKLNHPNVLEIGSGAGMITRIILDKYGGVATLLDYSKEALGFSETKTFNDKSYNVDFVREDIFKVAPEQKFDIVHSQGLLEHFKGIGQLSLLRKHKDFAKRYGLVLISVPRRKKSNSLLSQLIKFFHKGEMPWGYERPLALEELRQLFLNCGLEVLSWHEGFVNLAMLGRRI